MSSPESRELEEREVLEVLTTLAGESRVYGMHLHNARPVIQRLAEDVMPAGLLLTSIEVALAQRPGPGTPLHVGQLALALLRELRH